MADEQQTTGATTDQTAEQSSTTTQETTPETEKSLLNQPEKIEAPAGAPEKYEAFTAPEGFDLDAAAMEKASAIFKDLGLPQASAQKLVDFYAEASQQAAKASQDFYVATRKSWIDEVKADPEIGGAKLAGVKADIGRAIDGLLTDKAMNKSFRDALDYTGAGDHPAFIRAFHKFVQPLLETLGKDHVTGRGPTKESQTAPGASARPSIANALYGQPQS